MSPSRSLLLIFLASLAPLAAAEPDAADRPGWSFPEATLVEVIAAVRDRVGVNLVVDWAALGRVGIDPEDPITIELGPVPPRVVLNLALLLANARAGVAPEEAAGWSIDDGIVGVSTRDRLAERSTRVVIYSVRDLLIDVPDFDDAPTFDLTELLPGGDRGNDSARARAGRAEAARQPGTPTQRVLF